MSNQAPQIHREVTSILDQGTEAVKQVVDAYLAQRTTERDMNWLCIQMAKEFGAVIIHTDLAREAIRGGTDGRDMDEYFETIKEEIAHYQAYHNLVDRTIGKDSSIPVPDIYRYLLTKMEDGKMAPDDVMIGMAERWPEHHKYLASTAPYAKNKHPWVAKIFGATMEGAAGGWHWCMSQVPQYDDFLTQVAKLQKGIAIDELQHGPQMLADLCDEYSDDFNIDLEEFYGELREQRYQEVRQRNEQFLHPLDEDQLEAIHRQLQTGSLKGFDLYSKVA
jgi:hypothetical protein